MEVIIDAKNKSLGRLATEISYYLQGKHLVSYDPSKDEKIFVLVKNLNQTKFTGKKLEKIIEKHTDYIGHIKRIPLKDLWERNRLKILKMVVSKMLPKNKLRKKRLLRIKLIEE